MASNPGPVIVSREISCQSPSHDGKTFGQPLNGVAVYIAAGGRQECDSHRRFQEPTNEIDGREDDDSDGWIDCASFVSGANCPVGTTHKAEHSPSNVDVVGVETGTAPFCVEPTERMQTSGFLLVEDSHISHDDQNSIHVSPSQRNGTWEGFSEEQSQAMDQKSPNPKGQLYERNATTRGSETITSFLRGNLELAPSQQDRPEERTHLIKSSDKIGPLPEPTAILDPSDNKASNSKAPILAPDESKPNASDPLSDSFYAQALSRDERQRQFLIQRQVLAERKKSSKWAQRFQFMRRAMETGNVQAILEQNRGRRCCW